VFEREEKEKGRIKLIKNLFKWKKQIFDPFEDKNIFAHNKSLKENFPSIRATFFSSIVAFLKGVNVELF